VRLGVCRAFFLGRTAKSPLCCEFFMHDKEPLSCVVFFFRMAKNLCCVSLFCAWKTSKPLPPVTTLHNCLPTYFSPDPLSCFMIKCTAKTYMFVMRFHTTHDIVLKIIFVLLFISPLQKHILYSTFQFYTCLDKFTIFNNYLSHKEFCPYLSNLNCKCIK
jgi:hypothetical protein